MVRVYYTYTQGLCHSVLCKADCVLLSLSYTTVTAVQSLELSYAYRHQKLTLYVCIFKDSVRTPQQTHTVSVIAIIKKQAVL